MTGLLWEGLCRASGTMLHHKLCRSWPHSAAATLAGPLSGLYLCRLDCAGIQPDAAAAGADFKLQQLPGQGWSPAGGTVQGPRTTLHH